MAERLLRAAGLHFYRCPDCRHRGRHLGPIHRGARAAPLRREQRKAARRKTATLVVAVALATLLGVGAGLFLHS